jgi:hypothetical protein
MRKDIKKIRSVQAERSQATLGNQSIPPTPIREFPPSSRKQSAPGIFSLAGGGGGGGSGNSPVREIDSALETEPNAITSTGKRNSLTPARSAGERDLVLGTIYPELQHPPLSYPSEMPVEIRRIQEENNEVLWRVNNAPVQYRKTNGKEEDEESHETE